MTEPQTPAAVTAPAGVLERVGEWALARWADGAASSALAGEAVLRVAPALRGKVRRRAGDLMNLIYDTSAAALPMVALVNILVGAIVAFVGGVQLRRLGAEVYVSNLIGVTEVREIAAMQGGGQVDTLARQLADRIASTAEALPPRTGADTVSRGPDR